MKSVRGREEETRAEKLQLIDDQIAGGKLIVRQMTAEERLRYPLRTDAPANKHKRD